MKTPVLGTVAVALLASLTPCQNLADFGIPASSDTPAQAEALREVKAPDKVKATANADLGEKVISGATVQDAVNGAVQDLISSGDTVRWIATPSGLGLVATGEWSYGTDSKNPNLVLISQRKAALNALLAAKSEMSKALGKTSIKGKQALHRQMKILDDKEATYVNIKDGSTEELATSIAHTLRGVVVYDVQDDPAEGLVTVALVTTPKTQGAVQEAANGNILAGNLQAGMEKVFAQIKSCVIPPGGGKTVTVPSTGQVAWVGFGSQICRKHKNRDVVRILKQEARDTARERARAALLAVINGEDVSAATDLNEEFTQEIKEMETVVDAEGNEELNKLEQEQVTAVATQAKVRTFGSEVVGDLPEGVMVENYLTRDGNWAYAVALYMPELTKAAQDLNKHMQEHSPLTAGGAKSVRSFVIQPDGSFKVGKDGRLIPTSMGRGRVTLDEDL